MNRRIFGVLALILSLAMTLSACGTPGGNGGATEAPSAKTEAPAPTAGDGANTIGDLGQDETDPSAHEMSDETLKVLLDDEPNVLTPQYSSPSSPGITIGGCIFDTLYRWNNETKSAEPCLATDYEWVDDTHIRFFLREGVVGHDGTELVAEDVLFSLEFGMAGTNSNWARIFNYEGTVIEDDHTIVIALNNSFPNVIDILTGPSYGIVNKSAVEAAGGIEASTRSTTVGFGPYTFDAWESGQYIRLVRNDDYWDADQVPYYKYIEFTWNTDTATRSMAVQSGDVDVTFNLTATQITNMNGMDGISVYATSSDCALALYMNCSAEPFSDERVRNAINLAIDRDAIVGLIYNGYVTSTETNFTQMSQYYSPPETPAARDVEAAKALLAEAGYPDGFTMKCMIVSKNVNLAQMVQSQLEGIGVKLDISQVEFSAMMGTLMSGEYECYITDISSNDPARLLIRLDGRLPLPQAAGGCQFKSDELNALIDIAVYNMDRDARLQAYADIQDFIREHHPLVGLCSEIFSSAFGSDLTGVGYDASGFPDVSRVRPIGK